MQNQLTNKRMQFWNEEDIHNGNIIGSYSFDINGSCFYYSYKQGKRTKLYDGDLVYPHTWRLVNDSILNVMGFDRRILKFIDDTLVLQNIKTNDTIFLIKAEVASSSGD